MILQATVSWADAEAIHQIYTKSVSLTNSTGVAHQVDHIIPLVHHLVCVWFALRIKPTSAYSI